MVTRECRIGSLSWFAGVWWLGLSWVAHVAARGATRAGWFRVAWVLVGWTQWTTGQAVACAREGGSE
jgi:hypothetical protein